MKPRFITLNALLQLLLFDLVMAVGRFSHVYHMIRDQKLSRELARTGIVDDVLEAVNLACVWYPKQALCLQRSFAVVRLLRRYGIAAEMVLGAQKIPFKAHAWVEVNGKPVNERVNVQTKYQVWDRC